MDLISCSQKGADQPPVSAQKLDQDNKIEKKEKQGYITPGQPKRVAAAVFHPLPLNKFPKATRHFFSPPGDMSIPRRP